MINSYSAMWDPGVFLLLGQDSDMRHFQAVLASFAEESQAQSQEGASKCSRRAPEQPRRGPKLWRTPAMRYRSLQYNQREDVFEWFGFGKKLRITSLKISLSQI